MGQMISKSIAIAKAEEGLSLTAYWDGIGGVFTIGYGWNMQSHGYNPSRCAGMTWTKTRAEAELAKEINTAAGVVAMKWPWAVHLNEVRQSVLVLMTFQLGGHGVEDFKSFLAALESGDYERAADEMLDSKWARQCHNRANRMAKTMRTGKWLDEYNGVRV